MPCICTEIFYLLQSTSAFLFCHSHTHSAYVKTEPQRFEMPMPDIIQLESRLMLVFWLQVHAVPPGLAAAGKTPEKSWFPQRWRVKFWPWSSSHTWKNSDMLFQPEVFLKEMDLDVLSRAHLPQLPPSSSSPALLHWLVYTCIFLIWL